MAVSVIIYRHSLTHKKHAMQKRIYKIGTETFTMYNGKYPKAVEKKIKNTLERIVKPYLRKQK